MVSIFESRFFHLIHLRLVDIIFETIKYLSFSSMPLIAEKNSLLISHADIFVDSGLGL